MEKLPRYRVITCGDPAAAVRELREQAFVAILADVDVPECCRALEGQSLSTPVIALAGDAGFAWGRAAQVVVKNAEGLASLPQVVDCAIRCRNAQETAREATQLARVLFDASPIAIHITDPQGLVQRWNRAAEETFGWLEPEVLGTFLPTILPEEKDAYLSSLGRIVAGTERAIGEDSRRLKRDGTAIHVTVWKELLHDSDGRVNGVMSLVADSSEKMKLQHQLRQAQRLEAVGQLAGGVAHDFNNLLTIISGYSDLAIGGLEPDDPIRQNIEEVIKAANRATALTSQLLAFSRKQVLKPKVIDLNEVIADLEKMLRRLIGENIDLITVLKPDIGRVKADPGQIEQVIVNLAVNARDAMPYGGKLVIETANVELDAHYAAHHIGTEPGSYVVVSVSDSGHGMDAETQVHIFEPFFTTREHGKGTGLGLSTVYGIVKQSGGNIWVYSEPDQGTVFKVYLPLLQQPADQLAPAVVQAAPGRGVETVLLVEDEERVRELVKEVLTKQGYTVLTAGDGQDGLTLSENETRLIDLLLTDVVMPKMSGRHLAENLLRTNPSLKVLYMSGYTDNAILHKGMLDPETQFIQKPFTPEAIARKVRDVLDGVG